MDDVCQMADMESLPKELFHSPPTNISRNMFWLGYMTELMSEFWGGQVFFKKFCIKYSGIWSFFLYTMTSLLPHHHYLHQNMMNAPPIMADITVTARIPNSSLSGAGGLRRSDAESDAELNVAIGRVVGVYVVC